MSTMLRQKFAYEFFINRQGYPTTLDCFPNQKTIEVWKEVYAIKSPKGLEVWYLYRWQSFSKKWKAMRDEPFHIPKEDKLLPGTE